MNAGILKVANVIHLRGDATMWGADEETLEACVELVKEVQEEGEDIANSDHCDLSDLLRENLGLDADYVLDLWPI